MAFFSRFPPLDPHKRPRYGSWVRGFYGGTDGIGEDEPNEEELWADQSMFALDGAQASDISQLEPIVSLRPIPIQNSRKRPCMRCIIRYIDQC